MLVKDKKGFTLIEVISVLVILGILASLISVQYATIVKDSRKKLNEEQKSIIIETSKKISLKNRNCLTEAKNNENGSKIALADMQKYGYISNKEIKNLEDNTLTHDTCVIIRWDNNNERFEYNYTDNCEDINTCIISPETEKVLVSSFYLGDGDSSYTNDTNIAYHLSYTSTIKSEYCVTFDSEANCNWKDLDTDSNSVSGSLNLKNTQNVASNIAHLYIRNSNKNVIVNVTGSIIYDNIKPNCNWLPLTNRYIKNGSTVEIILRCEDISGIRNTSLLTENIVVSNGSLITVSDPVVLSAAGKKDFKFIITGSFGNGTLALSLEENIISDNAGNLLDTTTESDQIILDNNLPIATVLVNNSTNNNIYIKDETIELGLTNVSNDINSVCISNVDTSCTDWQAFKSSYSWNVSEGTGSKSVYVFLRDYAGNISKKTLTVHLDQTEPTCLVMLDSGKNYLKSGDYNIYTVRCTDNYQLAPYNLTNSSLSVDNLYASASIISSVGAEAKIKVLASSGDGRVKVYLNRNTISDSVGNTNTNLIEIANINVDNTPPINNLIKINYGATITHNRFVSAQLESSIISGKYCLSLIDNINSCSWKEFSNIGNIALEEEFKEYIVYAYFQDDAGNVSTSVNDSIIYNSNAVSCNLMIDANKIKINSTYSSLTTNPYSWDNQSWSSNNEQELAGVDKIYRAFIKDIDGNINYCDYSYNT